LLTVFTRLLAHDRPGNPASPRALVIAPTRELVVQIADDARLLGDATPFAIRAVYGGIDYRKQRLDLEAGVDILVGTPGRLIDYFRQHVYDLRSVEILVVDEADRMFDMGFIKDLRYLLRQLPPVERRQSMLFSATLSHDVMELAYIFMNDAVRVSVTPEQVTAENVEHMVYHVGKYEKLPLLIGVLRREGEGRTLVFVNMRRSAERLVHYLEANGLKADAITGDVDQRRRLRILADFKEGALPILVATDVASRGLHIEGVTHVINYDLPLDAGDYVHRIGRTARAGASGKAISLACEEYVDGLEAIETFIGFKLPYAFADEKLLAHPLHHPPREHREHRNRRDGRGGQAGRGPGGSGHGRREQSRPERAHGPSHPPRAASGGTPPPARHAPPAAPAPSGADAGAPKKRRRRRSRGGPRPPAPAGA
jgi:ATP-dependent RNA helicase RhlB